MIGNRKPTYPRRPCAYPPCERNETTGLHRYWCGEETSAICTHLFPQWGRHCYLISKMPKNAQEENSSMPSRTGLRSNYRLSRSLNPDGDLVSAAIFGLSRIFQSISSGHHPSSR